MPTIRTTFQPDVELEVSDHEAASLERQGLVFRTRAETPDGARRAAEKLPVNAGAPEKEK